MGTWPGCRTCRRALMEPATPYVRGKYYYFREPARRRGGGVRVDPADQPLLLPGALLPGHDRGQEGRPRRRATRVRRAPEDAGAGRGQQGRPGSVAAGDRAHPLRAVAVRQGDRRVPVDPAPVEVLAGRAARAGLDVHQGQGLAARLSVGEPAAARRSRRARWSRPAHPGGEPPAAHEQLLPRERHVLEGARRVRADSPPAEPGDRQVADRSGLLRQR